MEMNSLYIDGAAVKATSGETFDSINPANGELIATLGQASAADVDRAIESAKRGFAAWSAMTAVERSRILLKAVEILRARNNDLANLEVVDTGKPLQKPLKWMWRLALMLLNTLRALLQLYKATNNR